MCSQRMLRTVWTKPGGIKIACLGEDVISTFPNIDHSVVSRSPRLPAVGVCVGVGVDGWGWVGVVGLDPNF